jgi:iron complex transport system substrate-binding protein
MRKLLTCAVPALWLLTHLTLSAPYIQEKSIMDDLGEIHILGSPPERIISLAPNITEILFALGLEEKIVGVTRYCNYPINARTKTRIGGLVDPDLEKIIHLQPDLVIAYRGNPLNLVHRLKDLGLPVFVLEAGTTVESALHLIERIGVVTRKEKASQGLVTRLKKNYKKIRDRLANADIRPKVFINLHGKGLWTCGKNTFLNDLVLKAEAINIAGEVDRAWFNYNREELIHQNPDYIVVITKSKEDFLDVKTWFKEQSHLGSIEAIQNENIFLLNEDLVTRLGPRIFEAFEQLARILHSSSFEAGI